MGNKEMPNPLAEVSSQVSHNEKSETRTNENIEPMTKMKTKVVGKIKVKKADNQPRNLSYMVFPFYFAESLVKKNVNLNTSERLHEIDNIICNENTLWTRTQNTLEDNVLYEYIKPNTNENSTQFLSYSLRTFLKEEPNSELKTIRNVIWEKLYAEMSVDKGKKTYKLDFGHDKRNWNCPTLLISPSFGVGMLVLGVNPKMREAGIDDVIDFNYNLHKIDGQQKLYMPLGTEGLNERAVESKRVLIEQTRNVLYPDTADYHPIESGLEFQLLDIVRMLLRGIPEWTLFEKGRAHVFTYFSFVKDTLELTKEEKQSIILLTRCANNKYNIPVEDFDNSSAYTSTFRNFFMGSSIEGGCMCTIQQVSEDGLSCNLSNNFIKGFATGNLQHRYMWMYFMALMQRYVMLRMVMELSELDLNSDSPVQREIFNERYGYFCSTKIKSLFRNISSFSQHNQFYKFLIDNMEIDALYNEVESKMQIVDSYLQMQNNELLKKRNEQNETQSRKINSISLALGIFMAVVALFQAIDIILKIFK